MEHIVLKTNFGTSVYYDQDQKIRFDPPVYEQRYSSVLRLLELPCWKDSLKKIVEFGCAEMKFFRLLLTLPTVEQILEVDIDERLLNQCQHLVKPLLADYIVPRSKPFKVDVWRGDISLGHSCLEGTDVVIGIEIIEHLHAPVLEQVPANVFGYIKPKVALFSTPNAEYNVLFDGLLANGFRHDDHKFEWTRAQFEQWANDICRRYPAYRVKFFGIGPPPAGSEAIGHVSQLAVFVRQDVLDGFDEQQPVTEEAPEPSTASQQTKPLSMVFCEEFGEVVLLNPQPVDDPQPTEASSVGVDQESVLRPPADLLPRDDIEDEPGVRGAYEPYNMDLYDEDDYDDGDDGDVYDDIGDDIGLVPYIPEEQDPIERRNRRDSGNFEEVEEEQAQDSYWIVASWLYPVAQPDERSREQRLRDAADYQIRRLRYASDDFWDRDSDQIHIPLDIVHGCIATEEVSIEELRELLLADGRYQLVDDVLLLAVEYSSDEDEVDYEFGGDGGSYEQDWPEDAAKDEECQKEPAAQQIAKSLAEDNERWD
ncbi:uncharacterized protein LOC126578290 [Anopheles aquasalis]|uniref:uncharacterized protein LOC126578290 n=1 Tax=Anopheles aquasalis TaxID=42839 RepID=UPI00215B6846|nr:uncharacterized protein LOC126578290 [Anopheles aquasalis]